jgi:antitoxin component YwqK of YwqJK toxin-antitoxin module
MKKTLCLIILFAIALSAASYAEVTSKVTKQYSIISPEIITYYEGDIAIAVKTLTESGEVKSLTGHIPNGWVRRNHPNGKVFMETYYKNGQREGTTKVYFSTGTLEGTVNFKNGRLNGAAKELYGNGALRRTDNYVNDKREGLSKTYNDNGTIRSEINYLHGAPNGTCKFYDRNGKLVKEGNYVNGELIK